MASLKPQYSQADKRQSLHDSAPAPRGNAAAGSDLAPLMAGAWARGVADALDMLGQGAVLLDAGGGVLFASPLALARLDGAFMPVSGHLIGRDGAQNAALQEIISAALAGRMGELKVETAGGESTIRALPSKQVQAANVQLLKVILTIA